MQANTRAWLAGESEVVGWLPASGDDFVEGIVADLVVGLTKDLVV